MTDRPLRFGVSTSSAADRDDADRARAYEAMGFDTLVVADHLGGMLSPMTALLAAADATERLRIGTLVLTTTSGRRSSWPTRPSASTCSRADGWSSVWGLGTRRRSTRPRACATTRPPCASPPGRRRRSCAACSTADRRPRGRARHAPPGHGRRGRAQPRIPLLVGGNGDVVLATAAAHADTVGLVGFTSGTGRRTPTSATSPGPAWTSHRPRPPGCGSRADALELNVLVQLVRVGDRRALADEVGAAFTGRRS